MKTTTLTTTFDDLAIGDAFVFSTARGAMSTTYYKTGPITYGKAPGSPLWPMQHGHTPVITPSKEVMGKDATVAVRGTGRRPLIRKCHACHGRGVFPGITADSAFSCPHCLGTGEECGHAEPVHAEVAA
jgi:hypothetical protein